MIGLLPSNSYDQRVGLGGQAFYENVISMNLCQQRIDFIVDGRIFFAVSQQTHMVEITLISSQPLQQWINSDLMLCTCRDGVLPFQCIIMD